MSEVTKAMRDFLTKSPSVVFSNEVMELFIPVEKENAKLRDTTYAWRMVDHLSSENAELREQADFEHFQLGDMKKAAGMMLDEFDALVDEATRLVTENKRLRELVRDMWEGYNDPRCEECHLKDTPTCADCPICAREALVLDGMRELGIEVG